MVDAVVRENPNAPSRIMSAMWLLGESAIMRPDTVQKLMASNCHERSGE